MNMVDDTIAVLPVLDAIVTLASATKRMVLVASISISVDTTLKSLVVIFVAVLDVNVIFSVVDSISISDASKLNN